MVTEIYFLKALAQIKNKHTLLEEKHSVLEDEHSQIKTKHALLEEEHAEMKNKHTKLQEEYVELLNDRNDLEGDAWLWMMENKKLQAEHKKHQVEHSQWKAACASLVKEVERKILEEEYMAYVEQEYGQTHWPVARVAELEVELERKLAEAKEREQALMDKVATLKVTLKSEVESLQSTIQRKDDDFDSFHRPSKEATDKLVKELAEATAKTVHHGDVSRSLRKEKDAIESGVMTALGMLDILEQSMFGKPVEVSAPTQQRETLVALQEQRQVLREKSSRKPSVLQQRRR